jgi:WD40 repeat protein
MDRRNVKGWNLLETLNPNVGDDQITSLAWSPDGKWLASCDDAGAVRVWDRQNGGSVIVPDEHRREVYCLAWSPDSQKLAYGGESQLIGRYNLARGELLSPIMGKKALAMDWSADGERLASGGDDNDILISNPENGEQLRIVPGKVGQIYGLKWSPDGKTLAVAGYDRDILLMDAYSGNVLHRLPGMDGSSVFALAWSANGKLLAGGYWDGTVRLWTLNSNPPHASFDLIGHAGHVESLSFSHDGLLLASRSVDDYVRVWHCGKKQVISAFKQSCNPDWVGGLSFHPSLNLLAVPSKEDSVIKILECNLDAIIGPSIPSPVSLPMNQTVRPSGGQLHAGGKGNDVTGVVDDRKTVFISYSNKDAKWLKQFEPYLSVLEDRFPIDPWHDGRVQPSELWRTEIDDALARAKVAVLLVSQKFLASRFIRDVELPRILERERAKGLNVDVVLLEPSLIHVFPELQKFQAVNPGLKTVIELNAAGRLRFWNRLADVIREHLGIAKPEIVTT